MSVLEIVSGVFLVLSCLCIIIVCLLQDTKRPGLSSAISGATNDSFYGKNSSRTREAKLVRFTKIAAVVMFAATLLVNIVASLGA